MVTSLTKLPTRRVACVVAADLRRDEKPGWLTSSEPMILPLLV